MTTRTLAAETDGPIHIDTSLMGHHGSITISASPDCDRASVIIRTADETGPAADAVNDSTLHEAETGLVARVRGNGSTGSVTTITGSHGRTVVQSYGTMTGQVTGMVINGNVVTGGVVINGQHITAGTAGPSPIHITVVVPEASSITAHTQSAAVDTEGALETVTAATQSGAINVDRATLINAKSQSGAIHLDHVDVAHAGSMSGTITVDHFGGTAHLNTMSGGIRVHATAAGDITAGSMTGAITVTATDEALAGRVNVQAHSMTGAIRTPQPIGAQPRRRR